MTCQQHDGDPSCIDCQTDQQLIADTRADERTKIVAWLRSWSARVSDLPQMQSTLANAADDIESWQCG